MCAGNYLCVDMTSLCSSILSIPSRSWYSCSFLNVVLAILVRVRGVYPTFVWGILFEPQRLHLTFIQGFENARTGLSADTSSLSNDVKRSYHSFRAWMTSTAGRNGDKSDTLASSRLEISPAAPTVVISHSQSMHHEDHEIAGGVNASTSLEEHGATAAARGHPPKQHRIKFSDSSPVDRRRRGSMDVGKNTAHLQRTGAGVGSFRRASVPVGPMHHQVSVVSEAESAGGRRRGRGSVESNHAGRARRPRRSIASVERRNSGSAGAHPRFSDGGQSEARRRPRGSIESRTSALREGTQPQSSIASFEGRQLEHARRARASLESLSEVFGATGGPMLVHRQPPRRSIASPAAIATAMLDEPKRRRSSAASHADVERGLANFVGAHSSESSASESENATIAATVVVLLEAPSATDAVQV